MPRKFSPEERKRMLERLEHGATHTDLKAEFIIKDDRTLEKQLRQAREEQMLWAARIDMVKESLRDHLAEVRSLMESWSMGIKAPSPLSDSRYPLSSAEQCEQNRLFEAIPQHLPSRELWKSYDAFKVKWGDYLTLCQELHREVAERAETEWHLELLSKDEWRPGLTKSFSWETLDRAMKLAKGALESGAPQYEAGTLPLELNLQYLTCDGRVILYSEGSAYEYKDGHKAMIAEWAQSEKLAKLVDMLGELQSLGERIQGILQEALLRRDYVLYSCRLCPGAGKLAFK